ncbi:M23 family metallopeptidase [Eubacteriales bacterium mix99]|jgi:murein DD-endopeptidase MepM/ murein hydrolase activator NlpD
MAALRRRHRFQIADRKRFLPFLTVLLLLVAVLVLLCLNFNVPMRQYTADQFLPEHLTMYFSVGEDAGVPWYYLAAVDQAENIPKKKISQKRTSSIALHLTGIRNPDELPQYLAGYKKSKSLLRRVKGQIGRFDDLRAIHDDKVFPLSPEAEYVYENGYGDTRTYGGERTHEGIDIMTEKGVPIRSVCDGVIEQVGWNELGGYRIGVRGEDHVYYYYAHLSRYEGKPKKGDKVKREQQIGYSGDTGYGPEGTSGKFEPHLHFGMYYCKGEDLEAFNPWPFLRAWEGGHPAAGQQQ